MVQTVWVRARHLGGGQGALQPLLKEGVIRAGKEGQYWIPFTIPSTKKFGKIFKTEPERSHEQRIGNRVVIFKGTGLPKTPLNTREGYVLPAVYMTEELIDKAAGGRTASDHSALLPPERGNVWSPEQRRRGLASAGTAQTVLEESGRLRASFNSETKDALLRFAKRHGVSTCPVVETLAVFKPLELPIEVTDKELARKALGSKTKIEAVGEKQVAMVPLGHPVLGLPEDMAREAAIVVSQDTENCRISDLNFLYEAGWSYTGPKTFGREVSKPAWKELSDEQRRAWKSAFASHGITLEFDGKKYVFKKDGKTMPEREAQTQLLKGTAFRLGTALHIAHNIENAALYQKGGGGSSFSRDNVSVHGHIRDLDTAQRPGLPENKKEDIKFAIMTLGTLAKRMAKLTPEYIPDGRRSAIVLAGDSKYGKDAVRLLLESNAENIIRTMAKGRIPKRNIRRKVSKIVKRELTSPWTITIS